MAQTQKPASQKKRAGRRWWLQYRLRSLLALMLLACLTMGWWRWQQNSYTAQHRALAAVADKADYAGTRRGRPAWLARFYRPEVFRDVTHLSFHGRGSVTDADLAHIARFGRLQRLSLDGTSITDQGLAHLAGLTELDTLSLKRTKVTSAGLARLRGLVNLKKLQLSNTKIDGAGLEHLAAMKKLETLELEGLRIEDRHLVAIERLTELKELNLNTTQVRGPGLSGLRALPKLETILIGSFPLGDVELAGFPRLKGLWFFGQQDQSRMVVRDCPRFSSLFMFPSGELTAVELSNLPALAKVSLAENVGGNPHPVSVCLQGLANVQEVNISVRGELTLIIDDLPALRNCNVYTQSTLRDLRFAGLPNLEYVTLYANEVSGSSARAFGDLPPLRRLWLRGLTKPQAVLSHLVRPECLEMLHISSDSMDDDSLAILARASGLVELGVSSEGRSYVLPRLDNCNNLRHLHVSNASIQGPALLSLAGLNNLEALGLYRCSISSQDFAGLGQPTSLQELSITDTPLGADGLDAICKLDRLREFKLRRSGVLPGDLYKLRVLTRLHSLEVEEPTIGLTVFEVLCDTLAKDLPNCELHLTGPP